MREITHVDAVVDDEGWIVHSAYSKWTCRDCGAEVRRYRGQSDVQCDNGHWYNAGGQRLRDDWRGNPSNWDEDISDMDGFEIAALRREIDG